MKAGIGHRRNYVRYMATREGVEVVSEKNKHREITANQKDLIKDLLKDFPDSIDLFEYEDYMNHPTRENASAFISACMDHNVDAILTRTNYVKYIANRPRVERINENGMFSDQDGMIDLEQLSKEVANHAGIVWTHIISLKREDAVRLGYDQASAWINLCRAKRNEIARQMNIKPENLKWYAAYHDEGHHPHVHMIVYSQDPREGYVTKESIAGMRSSFANSIFKQDLMHLYKAQTVIRDEIKKVSQEHIRQLITELNHPKNPGDHLIELIQKLKDSMLHYKGRKYYAYVPKDIKFIVDGIVDELERNDNVKELLEIWFVQKDEITHTYRNKLPEHRSLSQLPEFKSIKNMILKLCTQELFEGEDQSTGEAKESVYESEESISPLKESLDVLTDEESSLYMAWSGDYKKARELLYESNKTEKDIESAIKLFKSESDKGNILAMYDLATLYQRGTWIERDEQRSNELYQRSLQGFMAEQELSQGKKIESYLNYRIGKFYFYGQGVEIDYEKARSFFEEAEDNIYALYSLGTIYYRGLGVSVDYEEAYDCFMRSSKNAYSAFAAAELLEKKVVRAEKDFTPLYAFAYGAFLRMESKSHDDNIQYRLAKMLYEGKGVEMDISKAISYLQQAVTMGNKNAKFLLSKIYIEQGESQEFNQAMQYLEELANDGMEQAAIYLADLYRRGELIDKNISKAIPLYEKPAEKGNAYALYQLAKIYLEEEGFKTMDKGMEYLKKSAEREYEYAQYLLGKYYLSEEYMGYDSEKGIYWLEQAAEKGNEIAQYVLGKLFLFGNQEIERNPEKALAYLKSSAEQGNIYAQDLLEHHEEFMNRKQNEYLIWQVSRLLHHLGNMFGNYMLPDPNNPLAHIERKLKKRLLWKRSAMGHKQDDQSGSINMENR